MRAKNPKLAKPSRPKMVVLGAAGIGKTWVSLDWPNAYYIDCEGGANLDHYTSKLDKVGALYLGPEDGANDFNVVLEEIHELATTKHDRKTLIIDSFSKLFNTAVQLEHDRLISADKKTDFGVDKKPAISQTRKMIAKLDRLDMNVILICHAKPVWQNGEQVGFTFDGYEKLGYELNLVVQVVKHGPKRKAIVQKSRFESFEDGEMVDWTYDEFAARFGSSITESDATPVKLASKKQTDELKKLFDTVQFNESLPQKWLDAAGVERFSEMDSDTIVKCIDFLKAKLPK